MQRKPLPFLKYKTLPADDQPERIEGYYSAGQVLWHEFYHEKELRTLALGSREITEELLNSVSARVSQLPTDR